jgi:nucleotide-binding universal stress UspA family protein
VLVPFGGAEHDWAALELGSGLARAHEPPLRLLGSLSGGPDARDPSRLLADAPILVQRLTGVVAEPLLVRPGAQELLGAAEDAGALVIGFSDRWSKEGLGEVRRAVARAARAPTLFVRRGLRPGGLAPSESRTASRGRWVCRRASVRLELTTGVDVRRYRIEGLVGRPAGAGCHRL